MLLFIERFVFVLWKIFALFDLVEECLSRVFWRVSKLLFDLFGRMLITRFLGLGAGGGRWWVVGWLASERLFDLVQPCCKMTCMVMYRNTGSAIGMKQESDFH